MRNDSLINIIFFAYNIQIVYLINKLCTNKIQLLNEQHDIITKYNISIPAL